jgi:zinc transport system substrate-binding protein
VRYFVEEYGLDYFAAFPGCADDTEPSARTVAFLIDKVRQEGIPAVFYIEFSNEKMADVICEDTGCRKLLFHSCHTVSKAELEGGVSYLQLMWGNVDALKEALG